MSLGRLLPLGCLTLLLAACGTVGPDYRVPDKAKINATAARQPFQEAANNAFAAGDLQDDWWKLYDDPQLDRLIEEALSANTDLRVAAANLARSEAVAMEVEGATEIKAGVEANVERSQVSAESFLLEHTLPIFNLGGVGIRAGYQLDLAGQLKRAAEAADADVDAARAGVDLARISVVADTALAYMEACAAGEELEIAQHSLALQEQHHRAVGRLIASGRAMPVDLPRAKREVEQLRAALPAYAARHRVALYRLAVLTGHLPGEYPRAVEACHRLPELKQPIPVGDGAALLRRRPDVRQAERRLAGATARVGVAIAALYPTVTLGLSAGLTGLLEDLGQGPTRRWSIGPLISWTLPGEEERARVRQADAAAAGAMAGFDKVVLNALQETEGALATLARDLDQREALVRAQNEAGDARSQVEAMYKAGRLGFLDDLDAQRSLIAAEDALARNRSQRAADEIRLFLALGGGWQSGAEKDRHPAP